MPTAPAPDLPVGLVAVGGKGASMQPRAASAPEHQGPVIPTKVHPSGFKMADSNFLALTPASDGKLYYTLSSHHIDTHARAYRYDPQTDRVELACDFGEVTGETGRKSLPQGKSHTPFFELDGHLYFSTHYGFFAMEGQKETLAKVPKGYTEYPGGHILDYNLATGRTEDLVRGPATEGIITLGMDAARGRCYGLTWPRGHFLTFDLAKKKLRDLGPVSLGGELGDGDQYLCLCRAFAIDPRNGAVFMTNADGAVLRYDLDADRIAPLPALTMRRDLFGEWDPHCPGHQGYNWRIILWHEPSQRFYGVHPRSGWLFAFDPERLQIELVERICCENLRRSGAFEPFRYGYLSLAFGPDQETLYYLSGDYREMDQSEHRFKEWIHLITYNLRTRAYADHGHLQLEDGRYPTLAQCLAAPAGGRLYSCPWIEKPTEVKGEPKRQCDLISFPDPMARRDRR